MILDPALPPNLLAKLNDLERRLEDLERPNLYEQWGPTPYNGWNYRIFSDPTEREQTVLQAGEEGFLQPGLPIPWAQPGTFVAVTSGTFINVWYGQLPVVAAKQFHVKVTVGADAATTGEVRLVAGSDTSTAATLTAGVFNYVTFRFEASSLTHRSRMVTLQLQARRTSGSGNINVYTPYGLVGHKGSETDSVTVTT